MGEGVVALFSKGEEGQESKLGPRWSSSFGIIRKMMCRAAGLGDGDNSKAARYSTIHRRMDRARSDTVKKSVM